MNGFEATALLAIVGLILVKEAGVPIPVPGDLIVIGPGSPLDVASSIRQWRSSPS